MARIPGWAWLVGLGGALLAFANRKGISMLTDQVVGAIQEEAFGLVVPDEATPYVSIILQVARLNGLSPFLLVALGQRETRWGTALKPDMTGDCTPRNWVPAGVPVKAVGTNAKGETLYAPPDAVMSGGKMIAGCWGRGIMQTDYAVQYDWVSTHDWRDPSVNIQRAAEILLQKKSFFEGNSAVKGLTDGSRVYLSEKAATRPERNVAPGYYPDPRPLSGDALEEAMIAAYNTGEGNVLMSLAVGLSPDVTTAGGEYGNHDYAYAVLARMAALKDDWVARLS